jgi:hypothetical protein
VAVARLDELGLAPGFIKIDVEGCPLDVLLGGMTTLRERRPVLMIEDAPTVTDLLCPLGYRHSAELFLAGGNNVDHL